MIYLLQEKISRSRQLSEERLLCCAADYMKKSRIAGSLPRLQRTCRGKPFFEGEPFHCSLSHSGDYWACAFGPGPLGLDIQRMDHIEKWPALARRFYHPEEVAYLAQREQRDFYQIWCGKEAWVKYTGEGISALKAFTVVGPRGLLENIGGVPLLFPAPPLGYCMALCGAEEYVIENKCGGT